MAEEEEEEVLRDLFKVIVSRLVVEEEVRIEEEEVVREGEGERLEEEEEEIERGSISLRE